MQLHRARSLLISLAALSVASVASVATTAIPAQAAARAPAATHITAAAAPTVALVGSVVTVTGTVTPWSAALTLRLQVAHKGTWTTVSTTHAVRAGAFTLHLLGPKVAQTLAVRVIRLGSATVKAGASSTLHLHFVAHRFAVTAQTRSRVLPEGGALTVSGTVVPAGTGTVYLQRLTPPATWVTVAKTAVTKTGTYVAHTTVLEGTNTYRVQRPSTPLLAAGLSVTLHVLGNSPVVSTTSLPVAVLGQPYQTSLTATHGTPPYLWSVSTLPAGLLLSPTGTISGRPLTVGSASPIVTVADANGWTASATLPLVVSPVSVKAWGDNASGQLGNGSTTGSVTPVTTLLPGTVQAVSGYDFTLALTTGGTVYAWGNNDHGQLGNGTTVNQTTPAPVAGLTNVVAVSGGGQTGYAVKADGTVWSWGGGSSGQLGRTASPRRRRRRR